MQGFKRLGFRISSVMNCVSSSWCSGGVLLGFVFGFIVFSVFLYRIPRGLYVIIARII